MRHFNASLPHLDRSSQASTEETVDSVRAGHGRAVGSTHKALSELYNQTPWDLLPATRQTIVGDVPTIPGVEITSPTRRISKPTGRELDRAGEWHRGGCRHRWGPGVQKASPEHEATASEVMGTPVQNRKQA